MRTIDPSELASVYGGFDFGSLLGAVSQVAPAFGPYGQIIGAAAGIGSSLLAKNQEDKEARKARKQMLAQQQVASPGGYGGGGGDAYASEGGNYCYDDGVVQISIG